MEDEENEGKRPAIQVNPPVFFISALLILVFVLFGTLFSDTAAALFPTLLKLIADTFGWFYVMSIAIFMGFALFLAFSPFGGVRLGPDDSEPDYSYVSWFAMLFSAGMGIGLLFFGVAEPIQHYTNPPLGEGRTVEAASEAMVITFFHWGVHAWAIYIVMGLALAYFAFRRGLPLTIRSALYPLLGDRIYGPIGDLVDIFAVIGTLFGVATSLGLGVLQVNAGFSYLFDVPNTPLVQVMLIAGITAAATVSVVMGLDGGIKRLSEANLFLAIGLLAFVFIAGPTLFLFDTFVQNVGTYAATLVSRTFNLYAYEPNDWISNWTLFYWGWWISWSPFVGMFIARISRGRTIREFVLGVMLVPTGFTFLWLTTFGDTALLVQLQGVVDIASIVEENVPVALFSLLETLPFNAISSLVAVTLVITFFVTSSDSGSLVIDMITSGGDPEPPVWQRVFWAVTEGVVAAVLLVAGGLTALQAAAITTALPLTAVLLVICVGLYQGLRSDLLGQQRQAPSPMPAMATASVGGTWQKRLRAIIHHYSKPDVESFLKNTVAIALDRVAEQIRESGLHADISMRPDRVYLTITHEEEMDFEYRVRMRGYRPLSFAFPEMPEKNGSARRHYRAEVEVNNEAQRYDIMGYTAEQVIADVLTQYDAHVQYLHTATQRLAVTSQAS